MEKIKKVFLATSSKRDNTLKEIIPPGVFRVYLSFLGSPIREFKRKICLGYRCDGLNRKENRDNTVILS